MRIHPARPVLAGLVLLLSVAGCGEDSVEALGEPTYAGEYIGHGPTPPFRGSSALIRLTLRDGGISFTAACNQFYADARMAGGVLRTSSLGGTEMGCPGRARQAQDEWMVDFFGGSPNIEIDGSEVTITRGRDVVSFAPADEPRVRRSDGRHEPVYRR